MNIVNFFDPSNSEHLAAYAHLCKTGVWPEGFIPEGTIFLQGWIALIMAKLSDAYLREKGFEV